MSDNYLAINSPEDYKYIYDRGGRDGSNSAHSPAGRQTLGKDYSNGGDVGDGLSSQMPPLTRKVEGYVNATKEQLAAIYE